jgi:multidrug efflux pump subunit AcrA (membrane-fusion protein)
MLVAYDISAFPQAQSPVPTRFLAVAALTAHNNKPEAANYVEPGGAAQAAPFFPRLNSGLYQLSFDPNRALLAARQRTPPQWADATIVKLGQLSAIRRWFGYAAFDSGRNSLRRELFFVLAISIMHRLREVRTWTMRCRTTAAQGGMMRVRASRAARRTVRFWPRALLREAPEIFEIPHWPLGWLLLGAFFLLAGKSLATVGLEQLDLVIPTHGRILSPAGTAEILSLEDGVLMAVQVREGQPVRRGDVLLQLASATVSAGIDRLNRERSAASLDLLRIGAQLKGDPRALSVPVDADPARVERVRWRLARGLTQPAAEIRAGANAERDAVARRLESADQALALKNRERRDVRAPMDGMVQGVAALAVGVPIAAHQSLIRILPADTEVEFEARVSSRGVRWIVEGQRIALRITPSTRESPVDVEGEVTSVGREAVNDAQPEPMFPVRIRIARRSLADRDLAFALAVRAEKRITADIQLGAQSMIDLVVYGLLHQPAGRLAAAAE